MLEESTPRVALQEARVSRLRTLPAGYSGGELPSAAAHTAAASSWKNAAGFYFSVKGCLAHHPSLCNGVFLMASFTIVQYL